MAALVVLGLENGDSELCGDLCHGVVLQKLKLEGGRGEKSGGCGRDELLPFAAATPEVRTLVMTSKVLKVIIAPADKLIIRKLRHQETGVIRTGVHR